MFGRTNTDEGLSALGSLSTGTYQSQSAPKTAPSLGGPAAAPAPSRPRPSALRILRVASGIILVVGSLAVAGSALYDLMRIGSCASGGPYVVAKECPPGTGLKIFGLTGSIFALLLGVMLTGSARAAGAAWAAGFCGMGVIFLWVAFGPGASGVVTDQVVGAGLGGVFILMGLPGLWPALRRPTAAERRQVVVHGAYGSQLSVHAPQDGGPARVVMARTSGQVPPS